MNDYLISQFIDNEMDLDEKITFVETVHASQQFSTETIALLEQEKLLREIPFPALDKASLAIATKPAFSWFDLFRTWLRPLSGFAAVMFILATGWLLTHQQLPAGAPQGEYRFVLYQPQVEQAEIIGTFTDWSPVPMQKIGQSGYWTLTLQVPQGEHRYSYLIENDGRIADPSVAAREHDDFGGENSVIIIGGHNDPVS
ncbi:MAG: glycogen-binding domain-containing protein [Desulforhopalus sp.]